jgi:mono/diheme cytochrome c family protein
MLTGLPVLLLAQTGDVQKRRANYLLNCGGCHGLDGASNSSLVPDLKDQVGFFMNLPEGRRYLVRLPNVAFSMMTDEALTDVMNYMVFTLGGRSTPKDTKPYTMNEVSQLRREPLTEVSLAQTRQQMVRILIDQFHATADLLRYGGDDPAYPH